MKSLKDFKCGWIIHNVDIKKGKNSQIFGEITIKASPPIYVIRLGKPFRYNFRKLYIFHKQVRVLSWSKQKQKISSRCLCLPPEWRLTSSGSHSRATRWNIYKSQIGYERGTWVTLKFLPNFEHTIKRCCDGEGFVKYFSIILQLH